MSFLSGIFADADFSFDFAESILSGGVGGWLSDGTLGLFLTTNFAISDAIGYGGDSNGGNSQPDYELPPSPNMEPTPPWNDGRQYEPVSVSELTDFFRSHHFDGHYFLL
jgi:hypothetical protein